MAKKPAPKKKVAVKKAPVKKAVKKAPAKKKVAAKPAKKETAPPKAAPKKKATKRKPNPSFMKPLQPDAVLGAIVGSKPLPRTQVVKKLWAYIKKNGLQDTQNKRMINADEKLQQLFGQKQASMFEMAKLVNQHLS